MFLSLTVDAFHLEMKTETVQWRLRPCPPICGILKNKFRVHTNGILKCPQTTAYTGDAKRTPNQEAAI